MGSRAKFILPLIAAAIISGCGEPQKPQVSFKNDVKPIIDKNCTECHNEGGVGTEASGFQTVTYETIMKGTKYGPVVIPGHALSSSLYRLVAGKVDPSIQMPHGKEAIPPEQIVLIEAWIEQGAKNN
jgi:hypothetical protein